jgi:hypothetical protein
MEASGPPTRARKDASRLSDRLGRKVSPSVSNPPSPLPRSMNLALGMVTRARKRETKARLKVASSGENGYQRCPGQLQAQNARTDIERVLGNHSRRISIRRMAKTGHHAGQDQQRDVKDPGQEGTTAT